MERIICHWSAGPWQSTYLDRRHYHRIYEGDGTMVRGDHPISANKTIRRGQKYAAHTLRCNTGSIGLACSCMAGAKESGDFGKHPMTEVQFEAMCKDAAELCKEYSIPVTPETVLSHAEVQPTLNIEQRGKWDFTRLPFKPELVGHQACGDYMRIRVNAYMKGEVGAIASDDNDDLEPPNDMAASIEDIPVRFGEANSIVQDIQNILNEKMYPCGKPDGDYGKLTRKAVFALKAENGMDTSDPSMPITLNEAQEAKPHEQIREDLTIKDLRDEDSQTIANADKGQQVTVLGGILLAVKEFIAEPSLDKAKEAAETVKGTWKSFDGVIDIISDNFGFVAIAGVVGFAFYFLQQVKQRRLDDAKGLRNI